MKKNRILFKVEPNTGQMEDEEYTFSVTALTPNGKGQIDEHVSEYFPELEEELGLEELVEGYFGYSGTLSKKEMEEELLNLGFKVS